MRTLAVSGRVGALQGQSDHGTHEALYLADPDGNGLELMWDCPQDEWPLDEDGHLAFVMNPLDLNDLRNS